MINDKFNCKVIELYQSGHAARLKVDRGFYFYKDIEVKAAYGHLFTEETKSIQLIKTVGKEEVWYEAIPSPNPVGFWKYSGHVIKIYDGDTITRCLVNLGLGDYHMINVRLAGIDTPELRGDERDEGLVSKERLVELIDGKDIIVETDKDKKGGFGRYLGTIWLNGKNINQQLLDEGLAQPYGR